MCRKRHNNNLTLLFLFTDLEVSDYESANEDNGEEGEEEVCYKIYTEIIFLTAIYSIPDKF